MRLGRYSMINDGGNGAPAGMDKPQADVLEGNQVLAQVLGDALTPLQVFHEKLACEGVERGIIGPRDQGIIWERHILNSAAIVPFVKEALTEGIGPRIADVGSGGGFPGIVLAACMPSCDVTLIEPMERRVLWLGEVINEMNLENVTVLRKRAEEVIPSSKKVDKSGRRKARRLENHPRHGSTGSGGSKHEGSERGANESAIVGDSSQTPYDMVTCRAVAPMTKLSGWTLPLLHAGGRLIALKGRSADAEIDKAAKEIKKNHGMNPRVCEAPVGPGLEETHVVLVDKG